jgi:hypothetical protein
MAGGAAVLGIGTYVTVRMMRDANEGAANDGKTYTIAELKNASTSTILCTFSPTIEPNGVVVGDSITFAGTGTVLDTKTYTITAEKTAHNEVEFTTTDRLAAPVKDLGTFVLHTSLENHMDHEAANAIPNPFDMLRDFFDGFGEIGKYVMYFLGFCLLAFLVSMLFR